MTSVLFESLATSYRQKVLKQIDLITDETNSFWLYWVKADYRPNNPDKPIYYVIAESERNAKRRFENLTAFNHLKVYQTGKVSNIDDVCEILMHPYEYIVVS